MASMSIIELDVIAENTSMQNVELTYTLLRCCYSAGLKTKEKEKTSATLRPPTRRGTHSVDQPSLATASHAASSFLCHPQLPCWCFCACCLNDSDEI